MDISKIAPMERKIEIKHPGTGQDLGISITLMSPDDERLKPLIREINEKALSLRQKNKSFTAEQTEANTLKLMLTTIVAWDWYGKDVEFEGKKPEFNSANVKKVLERCDWLRKQIDEELSETRSFFTV